MANKKSGLGKFLVGIGLGAGLGLLFAPKAGSETRKELKNKFNDFISQLKEIDVNEVKDEFLAKIEDIKCELEDLDKEKALKIAKQKGKAIVKKSEELYKLAVKKGTPILERAADEIRLTAIDVLNSITEKLEKKN